MQKSLPHNPFTGFCQNLKRLAFKTKDTRSRQVASGNLFGMGRLAMQTEWRLLHVMYSYGKAFALAQQSVFSKLTSCTERKVMLAEAEMCYAFLVLSPMSFRSIFKGSTFPVQLNYRKSGRSGAVQVLRQVSNKAHTCQKKGQCLLLSHSPSPPVRLTATELSRSG